MPNQCKVKILSQASYLLVDGVVVETAWNLINDGNVVYHFQLLTWRRMINPLFALHAYGASAIAVTALYLAFEFLHKSKYAVIENIQLPPRWWQCFDVTLDQIQGLIQPVLLLCYYRNGNPST